MSVETGECVGECVCLSASVCGCSLYRSYKRDHDTLSLFLSLPLICPLFRALSLFLSLFFWQGQCSIPVVPFRNFIESTRSQLFSFLLFSFLRFFSY